MSEPNPDPEFEERLDAMFQGEQTDGADDDPRLQSAMSVLELIARVKRDGEAVRPLAGDTAKPAGTTLPDSTASPDLPKTIGRFQIRKVLGRGCNGVVFLAHDPSLNRDVALKVPLLDALLDPSLRSRFLREAKAAAALMEMSLPEFEDAFCHFEDGERELRFRNGACVFLDGHKCGVYEARPLQCRTWPFWPENLEKKAWDRDVAPFCAGVGKGRVYSIAEIETIAGSLEESGDA